MLWRASSLPSWLTLSSKPAEIRPDRRQLLAMIHRVNRQLSSGRSIPTTPSSPATGGVLDRFSNPPEDLVKQAKDEINALIKVADVKKGTMICQMHVFQAILTNFSSAQSQGQARPPGAGNAPLWLGRRCSPRPGKADQDLSRELGARIQASAERSVRGHQVEELVKQMAQVVRSSSPRAQGTSATASCGEHAGDEGRAGRARGAGPVQFVPEGSQGEDSRRGNLAVLGWICGGWSGGRA